MQIRYVSDLHLEFEDRLTSKFQLPSLPTDSDTVLVLPGDVSVGTRSVEWACSVADRFKAVIFVPGNHEFYGCDFATQNREFVDHVKSRQMEHKVHVLNPGQVVIDGVRFVGATLWTNLNNDNPIARIVVKESLNDFVKIRYNQRNINGDNWMYLHNEDLQFIKNAITTPFEGKTVVVTHHLPSMCSVPQEFKNSGDMNYGFASNLDNLIAYNDIALWIHGHTHNNCEYLLGDTLVVCNPRGYPQYESNKEFSAIKSIVI